jgi:hypothetical protein
MTSGHIYGPKSLMKGGLYQSSSRDSWRVAVSSSDEISAITNDNEFGEQNPAVLCQNPSTESWRVAISSDKISGVINENEANGSNGATERDVLNGVDENEVSAVSECSTKSTIDFLQDEKRDMTFGRRIALSLMNKKWYNPRANENLDEKNEVGLRRTSSTYSSSSKIDDFDAMMNNASPNLEKAWAFYEHVSLYRYLVPADEIGKKTSVFTRVWNVLSGKTKLERAEPGEDDDPTKLYHPLLTPHSQLGDFGLGIGLYFSTLRAITIITLLAGLVSTYNIMYFSSDKYQPEEYTHAISTLERGSAICRNTAWVPCTDCVCADEGNLTVAQGAFPSDRCARDPNRPELTFVLRNLCDGTAWQLAACNYGALMLVFVAVFLLGFYLKSHEVQFDLDEQTAQVRTFGES